MHRRPTPTLTQGRPQAGAPCAPVAHRAEQRAPRRVLSGAPPAAPQGKDREWADCAEFYIHTGRDKHPQSGGRGLGLTTRTPFPLDFVSSPGQMGPRMRRLISTWGESLAVLQEH